MCEGIADELQGIDLGDKRLNERSMRVIERLAADPQASINAACSGWDETIAAYRFFDNGAVEPDKILQPHIQATVRRMKEQSVALVIQDTTEFDFSSHPPRDARLLDADYRWGFYDHTQLAVTPDRICLGVVDDKQFDRTANSLGKSQERKSLPIEKKESFRWLEGYRLASRLAGECAGTQVISVGDREADIYDIFLEFEEQATPADFIIRAKENRCTPELDLEAGGNVYHKVVDEVGTSPLRMQKAISLPKTPKREARDAELQVRAIPVTVKPPQARASLPTVAYNMVLVEEVNGPNDGTNVSWLLLTTLPIKTNEEIQRIIEYYVTRWMIEVFFRVLKSGCRVEDIQLETNRRVKNCLALYKIIAWRVMYLTHLGRECPTLPCTAVFEECEWKSVWKITTKEEPPKQPPTLSEFMPLLASLGGHNNRATDPPPGPQAIWVGIRRMTDFATAWLAFGRGP